MVHNDPRLDNIKKFLYLKASLTGEAKECIKSIVVSGTNYPVAWQLLRDRFENKDILVHNHIKALFELPLVHKESHIALRQLLDNVLKHIRCLESLGEPVQHWDRLLMEFVCIKLDTVTKREWKESSNTLGRSVLFSDLTSFLQRRCELLETLDLDKTQNKQKREQKQLASYHTLVNPSCVFCNGDHIIYNCSDFLKLSTDDRIATSKKLKVCLNCLKKSPFIKNCRSRNCFKCGRKHNTLLHIENNSTGNKLESSPVQNSTGGSSNINPQISISNHTSFCDNVKQILLATANIKVYDIFGKLHSCRCLLDSGSQCNFISEEFCARLGLEKTNFESLVLGINQGASNTKYKTEVKIASNINNFSSVVSCLVLTKITENLPSFSFDVKAINIPQNLRLADPAFNESSEIDMLLGATIFWKVLCVGQVDLGKNLPTLQNTQFGWIVSGPIPAQSSTKSFRSFCAYASTDNLLNESVIKFWNIEDCNASARKFSLEEQNVENHFVNTFERDTNGRFLVNIPFKENLVNLGESRATALNRFYNLEKRFIKNPELQGEYVKFMKEYHQLGHMSRINESTSLDNSTPVYYLPHHAVIKQESITTKVRVVFDGSCKSSSGLALNDVQNIGPTIQNDLLSIILNFRKYLFAITADIAKMYRQVLLKPEDRKLHRIFWRENPDEQLNCFELNTVTYGTASAAFLAIRCLKQLALENKIEYPVACDIIENNFYVDDLLVGADSIEEARSIQIDVSHVLSLGGFNLRKWLSNEPKILDNLTTVDDFLTICKDDYQAKTLGIVWDPKLDIFCYAVKNLTGQNCTTKRSILSLTAQIFDPLGILAPITIVAKILIQSLWKVKVGWDESIPLSLHTEWLNFCDNLIYLNNLKVPRYCFLQNCITIEFHGFSDASESAYGACAYVRCSDTLGNRTINLFCAKSKVAPMRNITLPRLELCAAVLLSNLYKKVNDSTKINFNSVFYWSDSMVALGWIRGEPQRWKTFVANRVSEIQGLTETNNWNHVQSTDNPADLISRGVISKKLIESDLWWHGPSWLIQDASQWPIKNSKQIALEDLPEGKKVTNSFLTQTDNFDLFAKYSSLSKLKRVFAYVLRFISSLRGKRTSGPLIPQELNNSLLALIRISQSQVFRLEIDSLSHEKNLNSKSKLLCLNPFLDEGSILRVGGRLQKSLFSYEKKHPIILPPHHLLTKLIVRHEHVRLLHYGAQNLLASIREVYWPMSGRNLVKRVVRECVVCFKANPKSVEPLMGSLPECRTESVFPFSNTGVDYAGPFFVRDRKTRGYKLLKSYIALFICMSTKAMHLELVSDLTTENFIATLKRFVARRGKPHNIYSDNATNFVGADAKLKELYKFLNNSSNSSIISNHLSEQGIAWHFIPPRSPHFGGLWEAGVKSVKVHLRRILSNACLTFEEFNTVIVQVESVLNSRPLSPLSTDPNDMVPLTPAHFLIGRSLTAIPEPDVKQIPENRLTLYQRLQSLVQHFWQRWQREYICELQTRVKWRKNHGDLLQLGALVILRDDNLPPSRWQLGRITELHRGQDGVVRVVTVQCSGARFKRAVSKICVLPMN